MKIYTAVVLILSQNIPYMSDIGSPGATDKLRTQIDRGRFVVFVSATVVPQSPILMLFELSGGTKGQAIRINSIVPCWFHAGSHRPH